MYICLSLKLYLAHKQTNSWNRHWIKLYKTWTNKTDSFDKKYVFLPNRAVESLLDWLMQYYKDLNAYFYSDRILTKSIANIMMMIAIRYEWLQYKWWWCWWWVQQKNLMIFINTPQWWHHRVASSSQYDWLICY